jgi:GTP-binding protein HflX
VVAVVGYTNAGKSTLMNAMTGADTLVENRLFATLDTLTRKIETRNHIPILLVDTVGFIRKLPHHLVESFKATLGDIAEADLWLHVIDASHPAYVEQKHVADETLYSIQRSDVSTLYVYNKIDVLDDDTLHGLRRRYPDAVFISAKNNAGIDDLDDRIHELLLGKDVRVEVRILTTDGKGIAKANSLLRQPEQVLEDGHCVISGVIESDLVVQLEGISGARVRYLT